MLKPLELIVYPKADGHFLLHCHSVSADGSIRRLMWGCQCPESSKRLTDAELAAEYWRASSGADEVNYDRGFRAESINGILRRFATLPHYDEEVTP